VLQDWSGQLLLSEYETYGKNGELVQDVERDGEHQ
jgi:hypothetical protein